MKRLLRKSSNQEHGTLQQLKNLLNRQLPNDPKADMNSYEDFLLVVGIGHILSAAMKQLGMTDIEDTPTEILPSNLADIGQDEKRRVMSTFIDAFIEKFVNLDILRERSHKPVQPKPSSTDGVFEYAREVLTLSLLHGEFHDAIREGDGDRVLRCWKFFLLYFKASRRVNYAIEALTLVVQYHLLLPDRLAQQLLWSRFINTHGKEGRNIPCDLYMEHCNRMCKMAVHGLGANLTPHAIQRVGKCSGPLLHIMGQFDAESSVHTKSGDHTVPSFMQDLQEVIKQLGRENVFIYTEGRNHHTFKSLRGSLLENLDYDEFTRWIIQQVNRMRSQTA